LRGPGTVSYGAALFGHPPVRGTTPVLAPGLDRFRIGLNHRCLARTPFSVSAGVRRQRLLRPATKPSTVREARRRTVPSGILPAARRIRPPPPLPSAPTTIPVSPLAPAPLPPSSRRHRRYRQPRRQPDLPQSGWPLTRPNSVGNPTSPARASTVNGRPARLSSRTLAAPCPPRRRRGAIHQHDPPRKQPRGHGLPPYPNANTGGEIPPPVENSTLATGGPSQTSPCRVHPVDGPPRGPHHPR